MNETGKRWKTGSETIIINRLRPQFYPGIPTYIDRAHAIAHNKIMIIDRSTLIIGSFNFTKAAEEKNAENLLIMKGNKPLVDRYTLNFNEHKGHSDRYTGRYQ